MQNVRFFGIIFRNGWLPSVAALCTRGLQIRQILDANAARMSFKFDRQLCRGEWSSSDHPPRLPASYTEELGQVPSEVGCGALRSQTKKKRLFARTGGSTRATNSTLMEIQKPVAPPKANSSTMNGHANRPPPQGTQRVFHKASSTLSVRTVGSTLLHSFLAKPMSAFEVVPRGYWGILPIIPVRLVAGVFAPKHFEFMGRLGRN